MTAVSGFVLNKRNLTFSTFWFTAVKVGVVDNMKYSFIALLPFMYLLIRRHVELVRFMGLMDEN